MLYVYASRTGNIESIIDKLSLENTLQISNGSESVQEDYILFTYTDGFGDIPYEVETFLNSNSQYLKGVVVSGDLSYGDAYCLAGVKIAEEYKVPLLRKIENAGDDQDIAELKNICQ